MKQKNVPAKAKPNANGVNKQKKPKQPIALDVSVETVQLKVTKKGNQKNQKVANKAVPPKAAVEEVEEEIVEHEDDSGADVAVSDAEEPDLGVAVDEENDSEDSDEDAPTEAPIVKKSKVEATVGIPKIKCNDIPKDFPDNQVIFIQNLPKQHDFKQVDIVEVFAKYGTLEIIKPNYRPDGNSTAFIAFTTSEAAQAALGANNTKIKGSAIKVALRKPKLKKQQLAEERQKAYQEKKSQIEESKDRMVYVRNIRKGTTEEQLQEHFAPCGTIEGINIVVRKGFVYAFVIFEDASSVEAALKLHNTTLNGTSVGVYEHGDDRSKSGHKDPERTVFLKNVQQLDSLSSETVQTIFGKCGEIESIDVICRKNVLAFITFKEANGAKNAMKLSNSTVEDLQIEVNNYTVPVEKTKTAVFVQNVKPGVTEEDIRELFAATGAIENVFIKGGFAIVRFVESDSFCKSFLLNETYLAGQPIFLEPYSEKKQQIMRKKHPNPTLGKRKQYPSNKGGGGGGQYKKFKKNNDGNN